MKDRFYWLALSFIPGIGNVIYQRLIKHFQDAEKVFQASREELLKVPNMRAKNAEAIRGFKDWERVKKEIELVEENQVKLLTWGDEDYPENLRNIYDPPSVLYIKGDILKEDNLAVAVVGSRNPTEYGRLATERIGRDLTRQGITVVSGMARGIDSSSHKGALSGGGRTIAVLGSGIDVIYPPENKGLYHEIAARGAVISEFPMGTHPDGVNFPARNRIISGLSLGVVIVEATLRSGSLITANCALEQGREVFAVPGNVSSPRSRGTNMLIKKGAKLVEEARDVLEEILPQLGASRREREDEDEIPPDLSEDERKIFDVLEKEPLHIDRITVKSGLKANQALAVLLNLELNGLIKQLAGKMFIRC
ncbi:MAG: DNA-processing protein DprA [Deltaproteobacteria bacterium]|nr:MAG: DNA-processing protein DprA [Deltaproteobacteria bacterium]